MDLFTHVCFRDNMRMYSAIFNVVILLISISVGAADFCGDFYAAACEGRPAADPSGNVLSKEEIAEKMKSAREQMRPRIPVLVKEAMTNDPVFAKAMELQIPCKQDCESYRLNAVSEVVEKGVIGGFDSNSKRDLSLIKIYGISGHPGYVKLADKVSMEFRNILTPKHKREDIEINLLKRLVEISKQRINKLQISDEVRGKIFSRLDKMSARTGSCGMVFEQDLYPPEKINYFGGKNQIAICDGALVKYQSKIALAGIMLHEIGHSALDPCALAGGKEPVISYILNKPRDSQYPVKNLIECLRKSEATGALFNEECRKDQIGEIVSDWFRAEVLPQFIEEEYEKMSLEERQAAYVNSAQKLCDSTPLMPGYPNARVRVNAVLASQPRIRDQIGCKGQPSPNQYCEAPADGEAVNQEHKIEATR